MKKKQTDRELAEIAATTYFKCDVKIMTIEGRRHCIGLMLPVVKAIKKAMGK